MHQNPPISPATLQTTSVPYVTFCRRLSWQTKLAIWKYDEPEPLSAFKWKGSMLSLAWSPDGRYIATGDQDSTFHFWIVKTGEDLMMYGYPTKVRDMSWDSVGRYRATGGGPQVTVWDCSGKGPEGRKPLSLDRRRSLITALAFRPSGPVLAVGGQTGQCASGRGQGEREARHNQPGHRGHQGGVASFPAARWPPPRPPLPSRSWTLRGFSGRIYWILQTFYAILDDGSDPAWR